MKKPRIGRPPKDPTQQRRHVLSVRVRDAVWEKLQTAAASNRRSISQEVEFRIEQALNEHGYATAEEAQAMYSAEVEADRALERLMKKSGLTLSDFVMRKKK